MSKDKVKVASDTGSLGFFMFAAWIGALVYFVQQSVGFGGFLLAILKSIIWPAFVIFETLQRLGV